ncbi:MAG TPA: acetate/propionate family kinase [Nitrospiraceae bacterium]|nr:acetate/propionate family kinase [Nitrospiraceae bacterium]
MQVLVINSGSSSIKFRLLEAAGEGKTVGTHQVPLLRAAVNGIGGAATFEATGRDVDHATTRLDIRDHAHALRVLFKRLAGALGKIEAVGHRVVHGGDQYMEPTLITEQVEAEIDSLSELAPLHNPACLVGIRGAREVLGPRVPMVAVFDTAFHQTMPDVAKQYALPPELVERHRIRRYGFHGIAHASLAHGYAVCTGHRLDGARLITLQLGNGCSIAAIAQGRSVETSMGFTPLEGLVMGTRSGDVDASIVSYLSDRDKVEATEVERWLNERSGLLGLSGRSSDMRELLRAAEEQQDKGAGFAIDLFCYRARKYLGAYLAVLNGADAIIFGGGIGENAPEIRRRICQDMEWCGLALDPGRNRKVVGLSPGHGIQISADESRPAAYVVAADEETWIALETARCVRVLRS